MDFLYVQKYIFKLAMILVIIGGLNWLAVGATGVNPVEKVLGARSPFTRIIYVLVGVSALSIMFSRDTYLPFLGETVMPCAMIPERVPEHADTQVSVSVSPGAKVVYWASEPEQEGAKKLTTLPMWRDAYQTYKNSGVVVADKEGKAILRFRRPQPYRVPWMGRLEPHVHFRVCREDGMLSSIKTVFLNDGRVEAFEDF